MIFVLVNKNAHAEIFLPFPSSPVIMTLLWKNHQVQEINNSPPYDLIHTHSVMFEIETPISLSLAFTYNITNKM